MKQAVIWIGIVISLLLFSVGTQAVLIISSLNDPSFAVVPDYEQKAANWDQLQAQRQFNKDLGWTIELHALPGEDRYVLNLELELHGTYGKPLRDAQITVEAFHNARASRIQRAAFTHVGDGIYVATLRGRRPGVWEFQFEVVREDVRFTPVVRKSIS